MADKSLLGMDVENSRKVEFRELRRWGEDNSSTGSGV